METENQKLDETIVRLETFQAEKRARDAEGKSTKATERSIESSGNKITRHEEKIRELRDQIKEAESQRQDLMKEQQAAYEEFHKAIERLKSKGVPQDFLRPGKADISISEKAIYWIPRLLVPVTIKNDSVEEGSEKQLLINLNLYNGNSDISCDGCGTEISTENYYQSLLEAEISPPTFICLECLKTFCSEHITFCDLCSKRACLDHADECGVCHRTLCGNCLVHDVNTNEIYCPEHTPKLCGGCGKSFAPDLLSMCKKCESLVCDACGRVKVKIKNEEVVARCVNCS